MPTPASLPPSALDAYMKVLMARFASNEDTRGEPRTYRPGGLDQNDAERLVAKGLTAKLIEYADLAESYNLDHEYGPLFEKVKGLARHIEAFAKGDAVARLDRSMVSALYLNMLLCDFRTVSGPLVGYAEIDAVIQPILALANVPRPCRARDLLASA